MIVEYTGTDGTVGSTSSWTGNKEVGKGKQTMTKLEPYTMAESSLHFLEPMEAEATAYTMLKDTAGGTLVTWGLKGENGFIGRIMGSIMSMDKMMAGDFDRGLAKLSLLVSSAPKTEASTWKVVPGEYPGGKYLGIRETTTFDKVPSFFEKSYGVLFPALEKAGGKPAGMPSGLFYKWDMATMTTELVAAVACTGDFKAPAGMELITLPAAKSLTVDYMGGYHGTGDAHNTLEKYINENKLEALTPAVEEYITDPGTEPDSNKWVTRIVYFVK